MKTLNYELQNDVPIGFIKIIPSELIAFADKPIKITTAEPEAQKTESKEKAAEKSSDKKKSSVKDKLKTEKKPKEGNKSQKTKKNLQEAI